MEPNTATEAKKYCLLAASATLLVLGCVALFNGIVDPFGMYRLLEVKGFNRHKPAIYTRVRLFKAYEVRRIKPSAIVLGTSRSHLGLRPSHEGWDPTATPRYNLAFDGASTKEMYLYLKHAHAVHPLKQVVLGLDTYHPTEAPSGTRPDFDALFLREPGSFTSQVCMIGMDLKLLTSLDTIRASITTLQSQDGGEPEWFAADGQRLGEVFFLRPGENFEKFGPRVYFQEIDQLEVGFKLEGPSAGPVKGTNPVTEPDPDETSLGYIKRIVEFCREKRIDLRICITPEHAHQMEISAAVGAWPLIENAKLNLVRLLSDDAAKHPNEPPIPLYDFSDYSSITTEALPEPGSRAGMKYYWDSSHFKEIVGDFVLDRLFGVCRSQHPVPEDFGALLTSSTIQSALNHVRAGQMIYRRDHPRDIAEIRSLVDRALQKNPGEKSKHP